MAKRSLLGRFLPGGSLMRAVIFRGVMRRQPIWLALGVVAWLWKRLRKGAPEEVATARLEPGESMLLTTGVPDSRRAQRRARRAT